MLNPNTITNLAPFAMLVVCVLAIGFMLCFFLALATDHHKMAHRVVNDAANAAPRSRGAVVEPGTHIALGVLRVTSVLASSLVHGEQRADAHMGFAAQNRQPSAASQSVYRVS